MFLKPYIWSFTSAPTENLLGICELLENCGQMKLLFRLWALMSKAGLYSCTLIHRHSRWRKDGQFHQSPSPTHGGGLKVAVSFLLSLRHSFTFCYPLVYLSTLSVYTSLILTLFPPLSLSLCLFLCFPIGLSLCPFGHFRCLTFLGLSFCLAGQQG